jgi:hypothetical protein
MTMLNGKVMPMYSVNRSASPGKPIPQDIGS